MTRGGKTPLKPISLHSVRNYIPLIDTIHYLIVVVNLVRKYYGFPSEDLEDDERIQKTLTRQHQNSSFQSATQILIVYLLLCLDYIVRLRSRGSDYELKGVSGLSLYDEVVSRLRRENNVVDSDLLIDISCEEDITLDNDGETNRDSDRSKSRPVHVDHVLSDRSPLHRSRELSENKFLTSQNSVDRAHPSFLQMSRSLWNVDEETNSAPINVDHVLRLVSDRSPLYRSREVTSQWNNFFTQFMKTLTSFERSSSTRLDYMTKVYLVQLFLFHPPQAMFLEFECDSECPINREEATTRRSPQGWSSDSDDPRSSLTNGDR